MTEGGDVGREKDEAEGLGAGALTQEDLVCRVGTRIFSGV